ncbi:YbjN domain-containing protein [Corynebacterium callunae]|uniref:YbjN domain-containing protein n=1 Tax=Corynebacterium callunae TaxID=1721 RepID=UPI003982680B
MTESNSSAFDSALPSPVDLDRVRGIFHTLPYHFELGSDRLTVSQDQHFSTVYFGEESSLCLIVLSQIRIPLDMFTINELARAITLWNAEYLGAAALLNMADDGAIEVRFRCSLNVEEGLTTAQLEKFLAGALAATEMAVDFMVERFSDLAIAGSGSDQLRDIQDEILRTQEIPGLLVPMSFSAEDDKLDEFDFEFADGDPDANPDADPDDDSYSDEYEDYLQEDELMEAEHHVDEVTIEKVNEVLAEKGIVHTSWDEQFLGAWINEIFIAFVLDNGPTLVIKGDWDPGLDPTRDFMKVFMTCNQHNERALLTKAFCHENGDGLQVRVEFSIAVGEGLSKAQLERNVDLAIHHILTSIDALSREITGNTAVNWPEDF